MLWLIYKMRNYEIQTEVIRLVNYIYIYTYIYTSLYVIAYMS